MSLTYVGETNFTEQCEPVPGKNEFGMDTLMRKMRGATTKLKNYLDTLSQGNQAPSPWSAFYLQRWESNEDNKGYSTVFLHYKGLVKGTLPNPFIVEDTATKTISVNRTVNGEDRTYDVLYNAPTKVYRYIFNENQPAQPPLFSAEIPLIINSFYINSENKKKQGIPTGLSLIARIEKTTKTPVYGTPYFEVESTVIATIEP